MTKPCPPKLHQIIDLLQDNLLIDTIDPELIRIRFFGSGQKLRKGSLNNGKEFHK